MRPPSFDGSGDGDESSSDTSSSDDKDKDKDEKSCTNAVIASTVSGMADASIVMAITVLPFAFTGLLTVPSAWTYAAGVVAGGVLGARHADCNDDANSNSNLHGHGQGYSHSHDNGGSPHGHGSGSGDGDN